MKKRLSILYLFLIPMFSFGAVISTTSSGGSFNNPATWVGDNIPGENDDVEVVNGATLTIDNDLLNYTVNSLTVLNGGTVNFSVAVDTQTVVFTIKTNLQIDAGGIFNSQLQTGVKSIVIGDTTLSSGGNLIVNGTMSFADTTTQVTFVGDYNSTISGTGATCNIGVLEVCKESSVLETTRRVRISTPSPTRGSNLKLTSGTYKISVADTISPFGFGLTSSGFSATADDLDDPDAPVDTSGNGGGGLDTADAGRGNDTIPMGDTTAVDTSLVDTSGGRAPGDTIPGPIDTTGSTDTTVGDDGRMIARTLSHLNQGNNNTPSNMQFRVGTSDGAELWLNHPSAMLDVDIGNNAFDIDFHLHVTSGLVKLGTTDSNSVTAFKDGTKGRLTMDGANAELNVIGALVFLDDSVNGPGNIINITNGTITIDTKSSTRDALVISSGTQVTFTGGTLTFLDPITKIDGTDVPEDDFIIQGTQASKNFVGSTINFGDDSSSLAGNSTKAGFTLVAPSSVEFGAIKVISNLGNDRGLRVTNDLTVRELSIGLGSGSVNLGNNDLTVKRLLNNTAGTLTVDTITMFADANGYSQIAAGGGEITSNAVKFMQYIPRASAGWVHVGFPVDATLANLDLGSASKNLGGGATGNIYYYDATSSTWVAPSSESHAFDGRGFTIYLGPPHFGTLPTTISVTGTLVTGPRNVQLNYFNTNTAKNDGWNLISNPYPSNLDWENIKGDLPGNTNSSVSVWAGSQYSSYLAPGINTNGGSRYIAPMQAFFVNVSASGDGNTLPFINNHRVTDSTGVLMKEYIASQVKLRVTGDKKYKKDETVIYFSEDAADAYTQTDDVDKLYSTLNDVPNLYSLVANHSLSINGYSAFDEERVIELGFETETKGSFTIELLEESFNSSWDVYIYDKKTEEYYSLTKGAYTFNHVPNKYPNRFSIHFKKKTATPETDFNEEFVSMQVTPSSINLQFDENAKGNALVQFVNLLGQVMHEEQVEVQGNTSIDLSGMKSGQLLLVRVIHENKVFTQKIVR